MAYACNYILWKEVYERKSEKMISPQNHLRMRFGGSFISILPQQVRERNPTIMYTVKGIDSIAHKRRELHGQNFRYFYG